MGADISRTGSDAPAYGTEDARKRLFQWIETGQSAVITRETRRCSLVPVAALTTVQRVAMAAWPAHGLTQARRVLGDLVVAAAGGAPQRLQKRSRDVAALLPVDAAPSPRRPRVLSTPSEALAVAGNVRPAPLSYGLPALDDATGGLLPDRLTLIAAAPGVGGSLLAAAAARHATLTAGRPVLYAASGLSAADVTARIGAAHAGVNYQHLRAGSLDAPADVQSALDAVLAAPLFIDEGEDLTVDALAETVTDVEDLALVVVDRLQAVPDAAVPLSGSALPDATRALARLARTAHVPVLAAVDSDDEDLLATLRADVLVRLQREGDSAQVTVTDADFDTPGAGVRLWPDFPRARFLDTAPAATTSLPAPVASPPPPQPAAPVQKPPAPPAPAARQQGPGPAAPRRKLPSQDKKPEAEAFIAGRVQAALAEHGGDTEAATAALVHKAIPDVMELLEICRQGGRYDFSCHPALPDLLRKQPGRDSDDIWEARPKWSITPGVLAPGEYTVTALDMNGAYLSALKTHLPIGALEHHLGPEEGGPAWDRRRSGIHRITPPSWEQSSLPNPLGNREEPGALWVGEPTLRLLLRAADKGWCERPLIHESFTSGASEGLLEKMREGMTAARRASLESGDDVTVEYLKAMYSKFVSTAGESNFNREIYRPDWVHLIRSQAFANLWHKAEKAHRAGVQVVRMMGTDELHVIGAWQQVFAEGRDVTQVKVKDTYPLTIDEGE